MYLFIPKRSVFHPVSVTHRSRVWRNRSQPLSSEDYEMFGYPKCAQTSANHTASGGRRPRRMVWRGRLSRRAQPAAAVNRRSGGPRRVARRGKRMPCWQLAPHCRRVDRQHAPGRVNRPTRQSPASVSGSGLPAGGKIASAEPSRRCRTRASAMTTEPREPGRGVARVRAFLFLPGR